MSHLLLHSEEDLQCVRQGSERKTYMGVYNLSVKEYLEIVNIKTKY